MILRLRLDLAPLRVMIPQYMLQLLDVRSQLRKHRPRRLNLRRLKNLAWDVLQTQPLYPRLLV